MHPTPNKTAFLCEAFLALFPEAEAGPGRVVLSDWQLDDRSITATIGAVASANVGSTDEQVAIHNAVIDFLKVLLHVPERERVAGVDAYFDGDGPPIIKP